MRSPALSWRQIGDVVHSGWRTRVNARIEVQPRAVLEEDVAFARPGMLLKGSGRNCRARGGAGR